MWLGGVDMHIRHIIDKINDFQLFVPAFQREYVWKRPNAKSLFESLIKKYPTGTLLTWETTKPPELKGAKKYSPEMGSVKLILDGQQRITTIYMIMTGKLPPYYTEEDIKNNVTGLHVNLQTLELEYFKRNLMETNPLWVNLTDVFTQQVRSRDVRKAIKESTELDEATEDLIDDNFDAIKGIQDREFPEQTIPVTALIKEAIDIFYVVNASGVNLTDAELALAQISGYWPEARENFKKKISELENVGFGFKLDFIVFALLAVLYGVGSDMRRLHTSDNLEKIQTAWDKLDSHILDYVINLLKTHAYVDHIDEINSVYALIPIIACIYQKPDHKLAEDQIKRIIKWFFYAQVRQRYVSQMPQKLDKELSIVRDANMPFDELLGLINAERSLEITKDDFVGRDVRHPLFSLMKWYFKSKGAVCLGTGVGLRQNMGSRYALEKDHIFPYSALRDNGYPVENRFKYALAQEITNRAILTQIENRSKSDTAALDYLQKAKGRFPNALDKQCIPDDPQLWVLENFEHFLEKRREILAKELNAFLDRITQSELEVGYLLMEDMIAEGEHNGLEFKQSLRWDVNEGRKNVNLELVVLKTIAAFNNSEGGILLIGVDDDQNVVGLDPDYAALGQGDRDEFELHLRTLIHRTWGVEYATKFVGVSFPAVSDTEICRVDVRRGEVPLFLEVRNKQGQKIEKFYVRSGNSSPPIESASEVAAYVSGRFPKAA